MQYDFDIIVVGGGPAGATCALYGERAGLEVLLVDKHAFPRDKICGDAVPGSCNTILEELGLMKAFVAGPSHAVNGVVLTSPKEETALIQGKPVGGQPELMGYTCRRMDFDNLLFQEAKRKVKTLENFQVDDVIRDGNNICGISGNQNGRTRKYTAKIVVGADGFKSIVARRAGLWHHDPDHWVVATRAYYRGIQGIDSAFEVHLIDTIIPGYFWIFPLTDGIANVGIGMRHTDLKAKGINLKSVHVAATQTALLRDRFKHAEILGEIKGSNLPLGSKQRTACGDGFLLLGDAAGLIDPFTGEGIGHAMHSGRIAAEVLKGVCLGEDYSVHQLQAYQDRVWEALGDTLTTSYRLQRLLRFKVLINLMISRAARNVEISNWIFDMFIGRASKGALFNPTTYWRLLFS